MNEYASSALLIRLAPDSGFNFIGVKDICGLTQIERLPIILSSKSAVYPPHDEQVAVLFQYVRRATWLRPPRLDGLFYDSLDEGLRGAGSSAPVR
jgi:hypothetical protein